MMPRVRRCGRGSSPGASGEMRISTLVPVDRAGRSLVVVALVDSIGTGFFLAGSALFLTRGLGLDARSVGLGLAIANGVGFLATVPMGMVSDRIGPRRTLVAMYAWHAVWMAVLPFAGSFASFVVRYTMVTIGDCGAIAVMQALVSSAVGVEHRTRTLGYLRAWRNVGRWLKQEVEREVGDVLEPAVLDHPLQLTFLPPAILGGASVGSRCVIGLHRVAQLGQGDMVGAVEVSRPHGHRSDPSGQGLRRHHHNMWGPAGPHSQKVQRLEP